MVCIELITTPGYDDWQFRIELLHEVGINAIIYSAIKEWEHFPSMPYMYMMSGT